MCNICDKCNNCYNFHIVKTINKIDDTRIEFEVTNNKHINTNRFCFVFPCSVNPSNTIASCYFNIGNKKLLLKDMTSDKLQRRKLYKMMINENKVY